MPNVCGTVKSTRPVQKVQLGHARAERSRELRQAVGPKENEYDDEDHEELLRAQTKHYGLLSSGF